MANITSIVNTFLEELAALSDDGGHENVYNILQPALDAERELHISFAAEPIPTDYSPYIGLIDMFTIPPNACRAHPRPLDGLEIGYEFDNGGAYTFPQHYLLPLHPLLRRPQGSPALVGSLEQFLTNWKIFTHDALSRISDWNNVVVAGGSVLACLSPLLLQTSNVATNDFFQSNAYSDSDIDIFLWGLSPEQAKKKMEELFLMITQALPWRATCVRKLNTISIHTSFPIRPIQIVLQLYRSPAEILAGFDVDSACCLFNSREVYISPRALAACVRQANNIDFSRRSPSYEVRLAKYADRGFEVYLPSLDCTHLNYEHLYDMELRTFPTGLSRLVVLELMQQNPYRYPFLYRSRCISARPPCENDLSYRPMDFKPVEKTLLKNNYDSLWVRIPYKYDWDAERVERHVKTIDSRLNSEYNMMPGLRRLHRHAAFCGTMTECLGDFCPLCPLPENDEERNMLLSDAKTFIRGPVQFLQRNPGSQMLSGSFNPIDLDEWSRGAYSDSECNRLVYFDGNDFVLNPNSNNNPLPPFDYDASAMDVTADAEQDLDMFESMEDEAEGSIYYSDAFASEIDLADLESSYS